MLSCCRPGRAGSQVRRTSSTASEPHWAMTEVPYGNVDRCLRALAGSAEGFGHAAVGGLHGAVFHVTSLAGLGRNAILCSLNFLKAKTFLPHEGATGTDEENGRYTVVATERPASLQHEGPGTLREACKKKDPLWIVFDLSGTIQLNSYVRVLSHKTIDGRGQRVKLVGKGLQLKDCEHIIVCNLEFEGGRGHDVDGIQIKPNSRHIWIDRCTLQDFDDGLIDITRKSTDITISRCHFMKHDKTMLIGADPNHIEDRIIRVTIHHCLFDGCRQRHPRLRFGKVHLYNNYTRNWGLYGICASVEAQILSQCNVYEAGACKTAFEYYTEKAADKDVPLSGSIRSEGDYFVKGAQGEAKSPEAVFRAEVFYPHWTLEPAGETLMKKICRIAGWQDCRSLPDLPLE